MDQDVQHEIQAIHSQMVIATERLGQLLGRQPPGTARADPGSQPRSEAVRGSPADEAADRIAYVEASRDFMYRTLYAVDFTMLHGRIDRAMLRDARAALLGGIDAANACLMLEGALDWGLDSEDEEDEEQ